VRDELVHDGFSIRSFILTIHSHLIPARTIQTWDSVRPARQLRLRLPTCVHENGQHDTDRFLAGVCIRHIRLGLTQKFPCKVRRAKWRFMPTQTLPKHYWGCEGEWRNHNAEMNVTLPEAIEEIPYGAARGSLELRTWNSKGSRIRDKLDEELKSIPIAPKDPPVYIVTQGWHTGEVVDTTDASCRVSRKRNLMVRSFAGWDNAGVIFDLDTWKLYPRKRSPNIGSVGGKARHM
jgi:hypothetical protein